MNATLKIPKITISDTVFEQIRSTIGTYPPECGGVLGGDPRRGAVTHFYFDSDAPRSAVLYTVVAERINPVISAWNHEDIHLCGFIHSHLRGLEQPSLPDIEFARRLLNRPDNSGLPLFLFPIVQSAADGHFGLRMFAVVRGLEGAVVELPMEVLPDGGLPEIPALPDLYTTTFSRVHGSYDLGRLHHSLVVAVGCGGSAGFIEDLCRCGVGHFILIDPDVVTEANLATQQVYRRDLGRPKVEAIHDRIKDILHHGTNHRFWGEMLARIGQRNFVLGRIDPDLSTTLGLQHFKHLAGTFADDSVWREQHPENVANGYSYNCPDCGGTGNLRNSMGKFDDTRRVVAVARDQAERRNT